MMIKEKEKKSAPIIGISAHFKEQNSMIADAYVQSVIKSGGIPVVLPVVDDENIIELMLQPIDGLIMTGGGDMDPMLWGENIIPQSGLPDVKRDLFDIQLIHKAHRLQIPIFGICRGMQAINVAFGGTLFQDIFTQIESSLIEHNQQEPKQQTTHQVNIEPDTLLALLINKEEIEVNSVHHQAIKDIAPNFIADAYSPDGICEGIENEFYPIFGVQWHPEHLAINGIRDHEVLFDHIVQEAKVYRKAKELHQNMLTIDSHCDTPMVWYDGINLGEWQKDTQVDFAKMEVGKIDCAFMVAYIEQKDMSPEASNEAFIKANNIIENIKEQIKNNDATVQLATCPEQLIQGKQQGKRSIVLGIENGYALNGKLENIAHFKKLGVQYITLCHNGDNDLADSARGIRTHEGLSELGQQVVKEMNRLGLIIDLAHAGDDTIDQVIELSSKPVVSTHSCTRALCHSLRNLTDNQIKKLAQKQGVCQICIYQGFLSEHKAATVETIVDHITHIVNLVGVDYVGIGSDFDGGGGIHGCEGTNELINITKMLVKRGFSDKDIAKIMGGNFLRVWKANQEL